MKRLCTPHPDIHGEFAVCTLKVWEDGSDCVQAQQPLQMRRSQPEAWLPCSKHDVPFPGKRCVCLWWASPCGRRCSRVNSIVATIVFQCWKLQSPKHSEDVVTEICRTLNCSWKHFGWLFASDILFRTRWETASVAGRSPSQQLLCLLLSMAMAMACPVDVCSLHMPPKLTKELVWQKQNWCSKPQCQTWLCY